FWAASFSVGAEKDIAVLLDVSRLFALEVAPEDRVDPLKVTPVDNEIARDSLVAGLSLRDNLVGQAECLCDRPPAGLSVSKFFQDGCVFLVELVEWMILVVS